MTNQAYWFAPPKTFNDGLAWTPTQNSQWFIAPLLKTAGVPLGNTSVLFLGWQPTVISDSSDFRFLDTYGNQLGPVYQMGATLPDFSFAPVGPLYGTMVPVPGQTAVIYYSNVGSNTKTFAGRGRSLFLFGYQ